MEGCYLRWGGYLRWRAYWRWGGRLLEVGREGIGGGGYWRWGSLEVEGLLGRWEQVIGGGELNEGREVIESGDLLELEGGVILEVDGLLEVGGILQIGDLLEIFWGQILKPWDLESLSIRLSCEVFHFCKCVVFIVK